MLNLIIFGKYNKVNKYDRFFKGQTQHINNDCWYFCWFQWSKKGDACQKGNTCSLGTWETAVEGDGCSKFDKFTKNASKTATNQKLLSQIVGNKGIGVVEAISDNILERKIIVTTKWGSSIYINAENIIK